MKYLYMNINFIVFLGLLRYVFAAFAVMKQTNAAVKMYKYLVCLSPAQPMYCINLYKYHHPCTQSNMYAYTYYLPTLLQ
jgi:hypothetical protein